MNNRYLCPKCRSELKITNNIILSAKTEKGIKGVLLISPELGDYTIIHSDNFKYSKGEHVDLFCPVCQANLGIPSVSKDLAEVIMIDENNAEYSIIFSEVVGKKCTIKLKDNTIIESYGQDVEEYVNFWGEIPRY